METQPRDDHNAPYVRLGSALLAQGFDGDADRADLGRWCAARHGIPRRILAGASDADVARWAAMAATRDRDRSGHR